MEPFETYDYDMAAHDSKRAIDLAKIIKEVSEDLTK